MLNLKTLNEAIPQMKTGTGFFSKFNNPVWAEDFETPAQLDIFFAMTYGEKYGAPIINAFIDDDTGEIDNESLTSFASMIYTIRGKEWERLYAVYTAEYNPIENTDVTETFTDQKTGSGTTGNTKTLNTQTANSGQGSVTSSGSSSGNNASNVFGFDSVAAVGDTTGSDSTTTQASSTTSSSTTVNDTGTITDAGTHSDTESITHNLRRHGNVGVMTMAQLAGGEIELWKWTFIIQIMNDIVDLITLKVY